MTDELTPTEVIEAYRTEEVNVLTCDLYWQALAHARELEAAREKLAAIEELEKWLRSSPMNNQVHIGITSKGFVVCIRDGLFEHNTGNSPTLPEAARAALRKVDK